MLVSQSCGAAPCVGAAEAAARGHSLVDDDGLLGQQRASTAATPSSVTGPVRQRRPLQRGHVGRRQRRGIQFVGQPLQARRRCRPPPPPAC